MIVEDRELKEGKRLYAQRREFLAAVFDVPRAPMKKQKGTIIIISGPSGSGKTTLHNKLLKSKRLKGELVKSVSVTTRLRRQGEVHGRDYVFVSRKQFLYKKRAGHFLESKKVFDNYYGTPKRSVLNLLNSGKSVLLCIDVEGAKTVCHRFPRAYKIFIKTSSLAVLKRRLQRRGSEGEDIVKRRLDRVRKELKESGNYDITIINDDLKTAYRRLEKVVMGRLYGKD